MRIELNPDKEFVKAFREKLKANDGYCPCRTTKTPETKCMCKEFLDAEEGECHCGLYKKFKY